MYFGGYTISPSSNYAITEQYNGTAWTEVADLSNARMGLTGSFGSYTAAVAAAGDEFPPSGNTRYLTDVEEWDGSSWSEGGDLPTATNSNNGAGTQTAGIIFGGNVSGNDGVAESYEYNGSSWTAGGDMNTARNFAKLGCGTQTASLICGGGDVPGYTANTELYDGSSWTEVNDVNNPNAQAGGGGTQTSAITARGQNGTPTQSESWDGTSWTITANTSTDSYAVGGTGASSKDAIIYAGYDSSPASFPTSTEEFSFPPDTASALNEGDVFLSGGTTLKSFGKAAGVPSATWASGGNLNTPRRLLNNSGNTQNSILAISGYPPTTSVESYDGSSWTEIAEANTSRYASGSSGPSNTDTLYFGGFVDPSTMSNKTEKWNGSSWTELANINTARERTVGKGTTTATLMFGGGKPADAGETESWNGSSWTEVSDLNTARQALGGAGTQTAALAFGGGDPLDNKTETWDGSSWTEVNDMNDARSFLGGAGAQSLALAFGGDTPGATANTEIWNGTSWTETNNLSTARYNTGSGGAASSAILFGGWTGTAVSAATEEFTADNTLSTVTLS